MILLIAIGNTLRRDDGAGPRVLELLEDLHGTARLSCHQLTPDLAEDIAAADSVIFIDAEVNKGSVRLTSLDSEHDAPSASTHSLTPAALVRIARKAFGFAGEALLCPVSGRDFSMGAGLSPETEANAQAAADLLRRFCVSMCKQ
jgi:hydrogenase maturation protease